MSKVLLVGKGPPDRGGIPTFLQILLTGPLADRHQLSLLNVAHTSTPQGGKATIANATRTGRDAFRIWRAAAGQDIVHIHSALAPTVTVLRAGLLTLAARLRGCAVIVHAHGSELESWLQGRSRRRILRFAMAPAQLVAVCWTNGEHLLRTALDGERVRLVDNGVEVPEAPALRTSHEPPRILYVGLLTARKGVLDLLEASVLLRERGVEHDLWLVGGTPDEGPDAEAPVREAATGRAELLGSRPPEQMPAAYAAADVFCLPSWYEAMPLSVMEASAHGLPVVATDVGDVARAVLDGVTGYVVPTKSPEPMAAALEKLLTNSGARIRMGDAGRTHIAANFSSEATAAAVDRLYAAMMEGGR